MESFGRTMRHAQSAVPGASRTATIEGAGYAVRVKQAAVGYAVSGHIMLDGQSLAGANVFLANLALLRSDSAKTDSNGYYTISFEAGWTYLLVANLPGYHFMPARMGVPSDGDPTCDFTATANP